VDFSVTVQSEVIYVADLCVTGKVTLIYVVYQV